MFKLPNMQGDGKVAIFMSSFVIKYHINYLSYNSKAYIISTYIHSIYAKLYMPKKPYFTSERSTSKIYIPI